MYDKEELEAVMRELAAERRLMQFAAEIEAEQIAAEIEAELAVDEDETEAEPAHSCMVCEASFPDAEHLRRHWAMHH